MRFKWPSLSHQHSAVSVTAVLQISSVINICSKTAPGASWPSRPWKWNVQVVQFFLLACADWFFCFLLLLYFILSCFVHNKTNRYEEMDVRTSCYVSSKIAHCKSSQMWLKIWIILLPTVLFAGLHSESSSPFPPIPLSSSVVPTDNNGW